MLHQNSEQTMSLQVTDDLTVTVIPDSNHEFLMPTNEVALGYDISVSNLRSLKHLHKLELLENEHFINGVVNMDVMGIMRKTTMWTKAGVIRLGFFVRSERAKLFRDWVEKLVLQFIENKMPALPETPKRKHNRITQERLVDIMCDIILIEDIELRKRLTQKIVGGIE